MVAVNELKTIIIVLNYLTVLVYTKTLLFTSVSVASGVFSEPQSTFLNIHHSPSPLQWIVIVIYAHIWDFVLVKASKLLSNLLRGWREYSNRLAIPCAEARRAANYFSFFRIKGHRTDQVTLSQLNSSDQAHIIY